LDSRLRGNDKKKEKAGSQNPAFLFQWIILFKQKQT